MPSFSLLQFVLLSQVFLGSYLVKPSTIPTPWNEQLYNSTPNSSVTPSVVVVSTSLSVNSSDGASYNGTRPTTNVSQNFSQTTNPDTTSSPSIKQGATNSSTPDAGITTSTVSTPVANGVTTVITVTTTTKPFSDVISSTRSVYTTVAAVVNTTVTVATTAKSLLDVTNSTMNSTSSIQYTTPTTTSVKNGLNFTSTMNGSSSTWISTTPVPQTTNRSTFSSSSPTHNITTHPSTSASPNVTSTISGRNVSENTTDVVPVTLPPENRTTSAAPDNNTSSTTSSGATNVSSTETVTPTTTASVSSTTSRLSYTSTPVSSRSSQSTVQSTPSTANASFTTIEAEQTTQSSTVSTTTSHVVVPSTTIPETPAETTGYSSVGASVPQNDNNGWIAAAVILPIAAVVAIVLAIFCFLKRRRQKPARSSRGNNVNNQGVMNPSFHIDSEETERTPPLPVRVPDFTHHVADLHRDSDYGFASEFSLLGKLSQQHPKMAAELPHNRTKNRFTNILPFDHSRVRLIPVDDDEGDGSDYINASFLPGFASRREFIAAQGPMRSTVDDFWRMIWEYNVTTIVMVTNLYERGREKCAQYWPDPNDPIYYGDIQIELISESSVNYYIIRILSVKLDQQSRRVTQYQFLTWPDFGVPKEHHHLLSFLTQVRGSIPRGVNQPILVHCSAGVGRTGTFIVIDHVLQLIKQNADIDVFGLVIDMRNNRPSMIQTEAQYIFAHDCVRYALEHGYHEGNEDFLHGSIDGGTPRDSICVNPDEKIKS